MSLSLAHDSTVTEIGVRNLMDIPAMARGFADDMDAGLYGEVQRAIVIVDSDDGLRLLGWGESLSQYEALGVLEAAKIVNFQSNFEE